MTAKKIKRQEAIDSLKSQGYFIKYDLITDPLVTNIGCTCTIINKESKEAIAIGASICSLLDQYNEKEAKARAFWRARKAFIKKETSDPINPIREGWSDQLLQRNKSVKDLTSDEIDIITDEALALLNKVFEKELEQVGVEDRNEFFHISNGKMIYYVPRNYCLSVMSDELSYKCTYLGS
jgi:hypothetical protein